MSTFGRVISHYSAVAQAAGATVGGANVLHDLVAALADLDPRTAAPAAVETLMRAARLDDATIAPYVSFLPLRYTRNCVYRDERLEVLVLCWPDGARSPVHDHGGSRCFVTVQRGALTVENYALVEGGRAPGHALLEHGETHIMTPGDFDARSAARDVHRVGALGGAAISLHVYARPLDRCLVFDVGNGTCREARNGYDTAPRVSITAR